MRSIDEIDSGDQMDYEEKKPEKSGSRDQPPGCACALGPSRPWTVVLFGVVLVTLAVVMDLPLEAVLIAALIPLTILAASAIGGRRRG
ncbi:MAG: hypothetical protein METHAR1v1_1350012 [Methanothrix sp.]|jgi:hypothetical protein|nr:MAG: hypothetical protein METHAR1v1_1350012 [Methanothrix sp.]